MSLFGAMTSGVSGLAAQSSAMGSIADNITNVNTTGYKGTKVDFQTLVTKQSPTFYSAGGVQSRPHTGVDVQGVLQSSASPTSLAISGSGFFLVNQASEPGASDQFMVTRAGSFSMDDQGFLRNTAGLYLQAWPTDADGNVALPSNSPATLTNQNVISTDFLETVNLNRVGGTADATTAIAIGANLPANDPVYDPLKPSAGGFHNIDVQFFDSLGNTNAASFSFIKTSANTWDLKVEPPKDTAVITLYDSSGTNVYQSAGQLEFASQPANGAAITVDGTTYQFTTGSPTGSQVAIGTTLADTVANFVAAVKASDTNFANATAGHHDISTRSGNSTAVILTGGTVGSFDVDVSDANLAGAVRQNSAKDQTFTVQRKQTGTTPAISFDANGLPKAFGVARMEVKNFVSGAVSMDQPDTAPASQGRKISLNFGNVGQADGLTQFGAEFTPNFIDQNGARYGVFSGVTISAEGVMSALFDNGDRRPIYKLPVVTFVNPNGLQARSGNAWTATEASGNPTLREANSGPAGQIAQSSLEASTVDIGEEFTNMIVVQRAYSAATKIISTADEMLDELVRIKR